MPTRRPASAPTTRCATTTCARRTSCTPGKYPVITFNSSGVRPAGRDQYTLTGDLTIKGITRPVSLEVIKYGELNDPGMMGHRISYGARGQINRTDFGVGTGMVLDGKLVVSNEIQIFIEGELVEQVQAAEAASG